MHGLIERAGMGRLVPIVQRVGDDSMHQEIGRVDVACGGEGVGLHVRSVSDNIEQALFHSAT